MTTWKAEDKDGLFRRLYELTLREEELLEELSSEDSSLPSGVLQTRFCPCHTSASEHKLVSALQKMKSYSSDRDVSSFGRSSNSSSSSSNSGGGGGGGNNPFGRSGSKRVWDKNVRLSLNGKGIDVDVTPSDEMKKAFATADARHKTDLGRFCRPGNDGEEPLSGNTFSKEERHTAGSLIREMAMEKISFFLTFDKAPGSPEYYNEIFKYVNGCNCIATVDGRGSGGGGGGGSDVLKIRTFQEDDRDDDSDPFDRLDDDSDDDDSTKLASK